MSFHPREPEDLFAPLLHIQLCGNRLKVAAYAARKRREQLAVSSFEFHFPMSNRPSLDPRPAPVSVEVKQLSKKSGSKP
jgi:hypothetical protein